MYIINDSLATHGFGGEPYYPMRYVDCATGKIDGFEIVDVRPLLDEDGNSLADYKLNIQRAISFLQNGEKVVVCCAAGQSRSNAIAIGVLVKYFRMDYWDAFDLVKEKVPIMHIDPAHIEALKKIYNVKLP